MSGTRIWPHEWWICGYLPCLFFSSSQHPIIEWAPPRAQSLSREVILPSSQWQLHLNPNYLRVERVAWESRERFSSLSTNHSGRSQRRTYRYVSFAPFTWHFRDDDKAWRWQTKGQLHPNQHPSVNFHRFTSTWSGAAIRPCFAMPARRRIFGSAFTQKVFSLRFFLQSGWPVSPSP